MTGFAMVGPPRAYLTPSARDPMAHYTSPTLLSNAFREFTASGKAGGAILILCTLVSLALANSPLGEQYLHFWHRPLAGLSIEQWVNDALMAVFFLLIGLELKR